VTDEAYGDPLSQPLWEAAGRHELLLQRCSACARHQHYPRPFCLACYSDDLKWVPASGQGSVYSRTTVMVADEPYTVALVDLVEGPRITTHLLDDAEIGEPVTLSWRDRDGLPPLPVFSRAR